jgi:hypothetical protein
LRLNQEKRVKKASFYFSIGATAKKGKKEIAGLEGIALSPKENSTDDNFLCPMDRI